MFYSFKSYRLTISRLKAQHRVKPMVRVKDGAEERLDDGRVHGAGEEHLAGERHGSTDKVLCSHFVVGLGRANQ